MSDFPPGAHDRFWRKVVKTDGCWLWTGYRDRAGYGHTRHPGQTRGRMAFVHRIAYEFTNGPIPEGLEIDHLCRVRNCVNPAHLEAVTHRENMLRSTALQVECLRGHRFDEANTYLYRGRRCCRECDRIRGAAYRERRRNAGV